MRGYYKEGGTNISYNLKRRTASWLFLLPLVICIIIFLGYLLLSSVFISFRDVRLGLTEKSTFIGVRQYLRVLGSKSFWNAMRFSLLFGLITTLLQLILGFVLAYFFYSKFRGMKILFTLLISPMFIAPSLFGLMNRILFNNFIGLIPGYIKFFFGVDVDFFSPKNAFWTIVGIDIMQWTPFVFLIVYAGLLGVPVQLIEASNIDGAGTFRRIWHIILPYIEPAVAMAAFLRLLESFRVFDTVYVLTGGGPGDLTTSISILIYRTAFTMGDHGLASAMGLILFCLILIPVMYGINFAKRRW